MMILISGEILNTTANGYDYRRPTPRPRPLKARWAVPGGAFGPGLAYNSRG